MSSGKGKRTSGKGSKSYAMLEEFKGELLQQMSAEQREVFADLQTKSSDCSSSQWFSIGIDIYHVFGVELGGKVFFLWSKPDIVSSRKAALCYGLIFVTVGLIQDCQWAMG